MSASKSANLFPKIDFSKAVTGFDNYYGINDNISLRKIVTKSGAELYEISYPFLYANVDERNKAYDAIIKKWKDGRTATSITDYENAGVVEERDSRILYEIVGLRHSFLADLRTYAESISENVFAAMISKFIGTETVKYRCFLKEPETREDGTVGEYEPAVILAFRRTASEAHGFVRNIASMKNPDAELPLLEKGTVIDCNYISKNEDGTEIDMRLPALYVALSLEHHSMRPGYKEAKAPTKPAETKPTVEVTQTGEKTAEVSTAEPEKVFPNYKTTPLERELEAMLIRYMFQAIQLKYENVIMAKNSTPQSANVEKARKHYAEKLVLWKNGAGDTPEKRKNRTEKYQQLSVEENQHIKEFVHSLYYGLYNTCVALDDIPTIKLVAKFLGTFLDSGVFKVSILRYFLDYYLEQTPEQKKRRKEENKIMTDIIALNESQGN